MGRPAALGLTCALLVTLLIVVACPAVQPVGAPRRATLKISSNLRGSPSMQGEVVATAKHGTPVEIVGETGRWYRVKTEQGLEAWIYKPLVVPEADEQRLPAEPPAASTRPNDTEDLPSPPERPVASADVPSPPERPLASADGPLSEGEQLANPALSQPLLSPGALLPTPLPDEGLQFDAIFAFFHAAGGYIIAGLVVVVILSIGLQLRAARQLKRAMREMEQIVELVDEIYTASTLLRTASGQTALAPMPSEAVVASLPQPAAELSALERAVLEAIAARREVQEAELAAELAKILEEQGFPGVLIKAVVGDIVRKTAVEGVPWMEVRYADGRYFYRLRPADVTMRTGPRQEG